MVKKSEKVKTVRPKSQNIIFYAGNVPKGKKLLTTFGNWNLYEWDNSNQFLNLKLVSTIPKLNKANYWLAYKKVKKVLVNNHDGKLLISFNLKLYEMILKWCKTNYRLADG